MQAVLSEQVAAAASHPGGVGRFHVECDASVSADNLILNAQPLLLLRAFRILKVGCERVVNSR